MNTNRASRQRFLAGTAACALALVASGCSGDDSATSAPDSASPSTSAVVSAEPTTSAGAEASGTKSASSEASSEAPAAPDGFHPGGWGPITVGMTPVEVAALGFSQEEIQLAGDGNLCSILRVVTPTGEPVYVTFKSGVVYGVSNNWHLRPAPGFATSEGLAEGDPVSEITRIYPGASESMTQGGTVYLITDPADAMSALSVTAPSGTVQEIRGGDAEYARHFESCIDFSGTGG